MKDYADDWVWTCAGCGSTTKLSINIAGRTLQQSFNPARLIASEKLALDRSAASEHATRCKRPV